MYKTTTTLIFALLIIFVTSSLVDAAMKASGKAAPLGKGENIFAAAVFNDSPGSSDLSLIPQLKADDKILIDRGSKCKAIEPKKNLPGDADPIGWIQPKYGDSAWQDAEYGVGYADNDDKTVIGSQATQTQSIYSRARFNIADPKAIKKLVLGVDYDDGVVIWINGVEVARTDGTDLPEKPTWDSRTDKGSKHSHEASKKDPPAYEEVELKFEVVAGGVAVEPAGKLATTWAIIKETR